MATIQDIREKYPEYKDLSDEDLAGKIHQKFYADMPFNEFRQKIGLSSPAAPIPEVETPEGMYEPGTTLGDVGTRIDDYMRSLASGMTFGFGEEIAAAGETGLRDPMGMALAAHGYTKPAMPTFKEELAKQEARTEEIPTGVQMAGEIPGAVLSTMALPASAGAQFARLPGWMRAAGFGGGAGALFGAGQPGTAEERLESAKTGALTGGAFGAAGQPIAKGATLAGGAILGGLRRRYGSARTPMLNKILQRTAEDQMGVQRLGSRYRALERAAPGQATLADAGGENVKGLVRHVAGAPGPAKSRVARILDARAKGEASRLTEGIRRGLDPEDYYTAQDAFLGNMRNQAGPQYQKAYQAHQAVASPGLTRILEGQTGKRAVAEAIKLNKMDLERGADVIDLEAAVKSGRIPLEAWDDIKRGFDSMIEKPMYQNALTGGYTKAGKGVIQVKSKLLSELDEATGGPEGLYAQARNIYAGEAEALGALRSGRKFLNMDPEAITREMGKLSEAGREAYRSGAARALKDVIDKAPEKADVANRIFGNARKRAQIRAIFPDEQSYRQLRDALIAEHQFSLMRNYALKGSMSKEKLEEGLDAVQEAAGVGGVMAGTQLGNWLRAHTIMMAGQGRRIARAIVGDPKPYNLELARALVNRDPTANEAVLRALMKKQTWSQLPETIRGEIGKALLIAAARNPEQAAELAGEGAKEVMGTVGLELEEE